MIPVLFGDRHDDVLPIHDAQQNSRVEPAEMIHRDDHIPRGKLFDAMQFDPCDELHNKANDGAQCSVLHVVILQQAKHDLRSKSGGIKNVAPKRHVDRRE
jgi:hypothetical protein